MPRRGERKPPAPVADLSDPRGLGALAHEYLEWCATHHYSPETLVVRRRYLTYFARWCAERELGRPEQVTLPILERFQRWLFYYRKADGDPLSLRGQRGQLTSVKAFFRWLARQHYLLSNPASELMLPRKVKRLPRQVLSAPEAERVLAVPDTTRVFGLRNRAILEVLYSTGLRRLELVRLQLQDLDAERGTLLVREGKGAKDRMLPIGERAVAWVEKYLHDIRPQLVVPPDDGTLFLTRYGLSLTPSFLSQMVRQAIEAAAIGKSGSVHVFRHTMATVMLEGGADIRYIQQMLGHSDLATTEIYTQVSIQKLKRIHTATHPGARLRPRARRPSEPAEGTDPDVLFAALDAEGAEEEKAEDETGGEAAANDEE
jgi:integrase/recombinase XerD